MEQDKDISKMPDNEIKIQDAAAILMQLEPSDTTELERLRDSLSKVATGHHDGELYPVSVQNLAAQAAKLLDQVIQGQASDPQSLLTEAGWLIEGVSEEFEATDASHPHTTPEDEASAKPEVAQVRDAVLPAAQDKQELKDGNLPPLLPDDADLELIGDFITEGRESIENAEAALLELELNPENLEAVNTVFRSFHTIKGTAAFMGLALVAEFAHHAESLLSRMRDQEIRCTGGYSDLALRSTDMLKELMQALQDTLAGREVELPDGLGELLRVLTAPEAAGVSEDEPPAATPRVGDILVAQGKAIREEVENVAAAKGEQLIGVSLTRSGVVSATDVGKALRTQQRMVGGGQGVKSSVRVRTDRLDRLIDMVGELVIAQSMVAQDNIVLNNGHHDLQKKVSHAGKIVRELQDLSMSMRMVPFRATFQKMARVVRDVSQKSGKTVNFTIQGEDTEIDRNMVDVISDPLIHMVRNAVDHGVEPPDQRQQQGKSSVGSVCLSAYNAGGNVVVELQDDGRGLNKDKIIEKAISRGLIESEKGMSDNDIFKLIFEPGFSTADQITDVSGRGVGMDVVKRSIEALKGRIEISSQSGQGTTFAIHLPLTLAITDGMLVQVGSERYIIPTININMSFRPTAEQLSTVVGRGELVNLRGELIPMFRLYRLFDIPQGIKDPEHGLLVVIDDREDRCALLVDQLLGQHQVVAKSLGSSIGDVQGISGAAILADGRVGLILDPSGLLSMAIHSGKNDTVEASAA
jgi:two-component system chemotaxis sensor kinase CheA